MIDGLDVDEFIRHNADPIWLHQEGLWEYLMLDDEATENAADNDLPLFFCRQIT